MMKKSSLTALLLGTLSGVLFAIGMCMALIAEWNAFTPGVVLGCAGVVLGIATMLIVYPFVQKYFEKGFMAGAVKG